MGELTVTSTAATALRVLFGRLMALQGWKVSSSPNAQARGSFCAAQHGRGVPGFAVPPALLH